MLLKKIRTKGFLGHLEGDADNGFVELDFADKNLWLIHGRNGAGKSSLFDAITMAFYKRHRGGIQHAEKLIHDKSDKAEVFVEFTFHDNDYRIAVDITRKPTVARRLQFWNGVEWETKNDDVDDWVTRNLKMTYETFVSSVLLRQGEADKFILAGATERRVIFLQLLQLEFYKKLTERAKFRQKCVGDRAKEIKQNLNVLENPSATEIKAREKSVKEFGKELEDLGKQQFAKQKEFDNAKRARDLKIEIEKIERQQKRDAEIFENAAQVEEKFNYFAELKENLLRFENVRREKNEIARIETACRENEQRQIELNDELETAANRLKENTSAQKSAQAELSALEDELNSLIAERGELKRKLDDIERIEKLESKIKKADENLQTAQTNVAEANKKIAGLDEQIKKETTEKDELNAQLQKSRIDFQVSKDRLENRRKGIDNDECPICGNDLKQEETRQRLIAEFEEAGRKVEELKQRQSGLEKDFAEAEERLSAVGENLKIETERRQKLLQTQAALDATIETWKTQITASYAAAERAEIRRNFVESETRFAELESQVEEAAKNHEAIGKAIANLGNAKVRLNADLENTRKNLENLQSRKEIAEADLTRAENQVAAKWKAHPALSDEAELENLRCEKDDLRNIETEYEKLKEARRREDNFKGKVELLSAQISEIPENHRREVAAVEIEFNELVEKIAVAKKQFDDTEGLCGKMRDDKLRYDERNKEWKAVQEDFEIWKKLAKSLGKEGLETKVVREAQQKIEDNANRTLQALSGGNFKLELTDSGKEMKIFVRDFTTGEQRQIEYFSGGEKFLTAVSLAVAIGQSASGQNIANTLIIDEGFGALDDKNRSLMVGELTRLSEILQNGRVIIVSHQDDVQENFANRFRINKTDEGFISVRVGTNL